MAVVSSVDDAAAQLMNVRARVLPMLWGVEETAENERTARELIVEVDVEGDLRVVDVHIKILVTFSGIFHNKGMVRV